MDFVSDFYSGSDLSLLKKVTLVIPTYNRNFYLSRCLWYHVHFPFGEIIVADSSSNQKKVVNKEIVEKLKHTFGANIQYVEYEEKSGNGSVRELFAKWGDAIKHVTTEYDMICADKEFVIPTTLCDCISYLDNHQDYDSIDATYYFATSLRGGKILFFDEYPNKCSVPYSDGLVRYLFACTTSGISTNLMALRRSLSHKNIYAKLTEYGLNDFRFGEFTGELLSLIHSKHHYISKMPYNCRDISFVNKKRSDSTDASNPKFNQYIVDGIYEEYMNKTISCLAEALQIQGTALNVRELRQLIQDTLTTMLQHRRFYESPLSKFLPSALLKFGNSQIPLVKGLSFSHNNKKNDTPLSPELLLIKKIIMNDRSKHHNDVPII